MARATDGILWILGCTAFGWSSVALAAPDVPQGTGGQTAASAGATELEGQGKFGTASQPTFAEGEGEGEGEGKKVSANATEFDIAAGGIISTGNARAVALTGASNLRLRRKNHQFSANFAGNYGIAGLDRDSPLVPTVGNVQGRVRYDIFVHDRVSLFTMVTARHDPFQGLELRLNVDPGVAVYALTNPKHRLWFEVGYDFQYDLRTEAAILEKNDVGQIVLDDDGNTHRVVDKFLLNHALRLYAGYANNLNDKVSFVTGLEYLQSFLLARRFRLNWDVGLSAQLQGRFSLATTFTLRYENDPLPDVVPLDTITSIALAYRFF